MLVLHLAPHPDDELIGAPATLMALRDAGHEILNVACSLGRPEQEETRRAELEEACRRAGFELLVPEEGFEAVLRERHADLVVGPSPHDRHPFHETVGRALVAARPERLWLWGLWGALPFPTTIVFWRYSTCLRQNARAPALAPVTRTIASSQNNVIRPSWGLAAPVSVAAA